MSTKPTAPEARRHYGRPRSVRRILADAEGRTLGGFDQELYGPHSARSRLLRIVSIAESAGAHAWVRKYLQPLIDRVRSTPIQDLDVPVIARAQQADSREDALQAVAQASDELSDLEAWLKGIRAEISAQEELAAAVQSEITARKDTT